MNENYFHAFLTTVDTPEHRKPVWFGRRSRRNQVLTDIPRRCGSLLSNTMDVDGVCLGSR